MTHQQVLIDTNIVLRVILNDQPQLTKQVVAYLENTPQLVLTSLVIFESFQVLTGRRLNYPLAKAAGFIRDFLLAINNSIYVENNFIHLETCRLISQHQVDYIDAYLISLGKETGSKIVSYDHDFDKIQPGLKIEPKSHPA